MYAAVSVCCAPAILAAVKKEAHSNKAFFIVLIVFSSYNFFSLALKKASPFFMVIRQLADERV
jgi:hypothetical protein